MTKIDCFPKPKRMVTAFFSAAVVLLNFIAQPSFAGDPFRTSNPRDIGNDTEAAFTSIFKEGDYKTAKTYLQKAESTEANEPLVYALLASLSYLDAKAQTNPNFASFKSYANKTRTTAEKLTNSDPLRGNLYTAVGHFLEGAADFEEKGPVGAVGKLQKVFQYLDEAKKSDSNDPEYNLITGYMDLMLAVNLPFADPAQAIEKLENYGYPKYLSYRGIAVGKRDLKKYDEAMSYANLALQLTPNNPEVLYLTAQILVRQEKDREALDYFNKALAKQAQLPNYSAAQITYERCRLQNRLDSGARDCRAERNKVRAGN